jgi:hypothetical protein
MSVSCEELEAELAELLLDLAAAEALIDEIEAAFANESDPMARMMLTMDLGAALRLRNEINTDIAIVRMNQELLGCTPPSAMKVAASDSKHIELHERLRKMQVQRFVRKCSRGVK